MAVGYQTFFTAQLTNNISDTDLTIPVDVAPTPSEGFLVIESTVTNKREVIYYTSKTSNSVICPANGRGYDGTTAVSHLQGAAVIMAPVGAMFDELRDQFTTTPQGWTSMVQNISTVTANGNRSYDLAFDASVASILSEGMRLRTTRTVASTQNAFSLDGSNDYYSKTSPTGLSFTTTFTCIAWVYMTAYQLGGIIARRNASTEGWNLSVDATGQVRLSGLRIAANNKFITSYQSLPLNRWVHVAATMDMAVGDTSAQKIWIDGVEVPRAMATNGTATALVQGTTALTVGAELSAGTNVFAGYIDQAAVFSSQLSDATIKSLYSQGLTGSESTLVSAFSNGSTTDLNTTNVNNLTAQNGATTVANSPFGNRGTSSTLDYALVMNVSTTTATVQVPEGCTIPTSGGVSAVAYSTQANPYGWVAVGNRWKLSAWDSSGTTTNPILLKMVELGMNNPLDNIKYSNAGSLGGTLYLSVEGNTRKISLTHTYSTASQSPTVTFPTGFLSSLQTGLISTIGSSGSTTGSYIVQSTLTTTGFTLYTGTNPQGGGALVVGT